MILVEKYTHVQRKLTQGISLFLRDQTSSFDRLDIYKVRRECIRSKHNLRILLLAIVGGVPAVVLMVNQVDPKTNC